MQQATDSEAMAGAVGRGMHALASELYPICRSITGDGPHSLLDIAERSGIPFVLIERSARELVASGLLVEAADRAADPHRTPRRRLGAGDSFVIDGGMSYIAA